MYSEIKDIILQKNIEQTFNQSSINQSSIFSADVTCLSVCLPAGGDSHDGAVSFFVMVSNYCLSKVVLGCLSLLFMLWFLDKVYMLFLVKFRVEVQ